MALMYLSNSTDSLDDATTNLYYTFYNNRIAWRNLIVFVIVAINIVKDCQCHSNLLPQLFDF